MDTESPPKRVTRARAAAKSKTPAADGTVKIATAASKAKATRSTPAAPAIKRRTRADDAVESETKHEDDVVEETPAPEPVKATRGRPRKVVTTAPEPETPADEEAPAPAKATRGRPKKAVEEKPAPEAARSTRGRPKNTDMPQEPEQQLKSEPAPVPVRKITRGRPTMITKPAPPKKSVKFEDNLELDKENIVPSVTTKPKAKDAAPAGGLKAKPVRKATVPARTTRGRARVTAETEEPKDKSSPLSPKKATQVATAKETGSDDELAATEKTPLIPLMRDPVKAPGSVLGTGKKLDFTSSLVVNRVNIPEQQNLGTSFLGSPARRPPQSPFKDSTKESPKRLNFGDSLFQSPLRASLPVPKTTSSNSPFKTSLLQSPARRPTSPMKELAQGSPSKSASTNSFFSATPKASTFSISRFTTPRTLTKTAMRPLGIGLPSATKLTSAPQEETEEPKPVEKSVSHFPGRLSAVLPRYADPVMSRGLGSDATTEEPVPEQMSVIDEGESFVEPIAAEPMELDAATDMTTKSTTPPHSPPRHSLGNFGIRPENESPFDESDSEDELASNSPKYSPAPLGSSRNGYSSPSTPIPFKPISKTPRTVQPKKSTSLDPRSIASTHSVKVQRDSVSITPLNKEVDEWKAEELRKIEKAEGMGELSSTITTFETGFYASLDGVVDAAEPRSTFFEDEMSIWDEVHVAEPIIELEPFEALDFAPTTLDDEDLALAAEADELSLLDIPDDEDDVDQLNLAVPERALSEASQEYGDENTIPIDPALLQSEIQQREEVQEEEDEPTVIIHEQLPAVPDPPVATPVRPLGERIFHTVSKVPLKPAAEDTPMRFSSPKRSMSVSKLPIHRPAPAVPSPRIRSKKILADQEIPPELLTPARSNAWSNTATPTQTPRRDLNDQILKGAVVYVDVHTTEGADASAVFVELLTQMGARCVKSWSWNPNGIFSPDGEETGNPSKIGITHVVFKDGGKRTLEKVKESKGVVLCVGVGWVLDCERMKSWLEESPYAIDTSLVPRGGHRRRKSMEPRALANMNGTLVSTPGRSFSGGSMSPIKDHLNVINTPGSTYKINRRASTVWERSPDIEADAMVVDQDNIPELSPVPVTPAPETISAYAEHLLEEGSGSETPYFLKSENLVQMTCPPKQMGTLLDDDDDDDEVQDGAPTGSRALMQRLMLARRKSLQWAPKVGSPLARSSSYGL